MFTKPASGGWADATEATKLTAELSGSDGAAGDRFGNSVAVDGDTVVMGAPYVDDNGVESGVAYVGTKPNAGWAATPDWTAIPDSAAGGTNATSYTVTGLTSGAEYTFWIRTVNAFGTSAASEAAKVNVPPAKPTGLTVNVTDAPTAVGDSATTAVDTAVDINVTANDTAHDAGTRSR